MTECDECKATLYPQNPEVGGYALRLKRYLPPLCQGCPHEYEKEEERRIAQLEERVGNIEEISAMPGQIPRRYFDQFQQLQGQVVFLQNTLNAALDKGKKKADERAKEQAAKKQSEKPTYRGLSAEDN